MVRRTVHVVVKLHHLFNIDQQFTLIAVPAWTYQTQNTQNAQNRAEHSHCQDLIDSPHHDARAGHGHMSKHPGEVDCVGVHKDRLAVKSGHLLDQRLLGYRLVHLLLTHRPDQHKRHC
jgi:hypothetical protein